MLQDGRAIVVSHLRAPSRALWNPLNSVLRACKQGVLAGFDQKSNVVLSESKERVYSMEEGVEEIPLGLYLVKGDMMCVQGPISLLYPFLSFLCNFYSPCL